VNLELAGLLTALAVSGLCLAIGKCDWAIGTVASSSRYKRKVTWQSTRNLAQSLQFYISSKRSNADILSLRCYAGPNAVIFL